MTTDSQPTPEQVEKAKAELTRWSAGSGFSEARAIGIILSDHARITAELTTCRETLRLKPSESLPAGVTRLTLQVKGAETERDWILAHEATHNAKYIGPKTVVWYDEKHRQCTTQGYTLIDALHGAMQVSEIIESQSTIQGKANG